MRINRKTSRLIGIFAALVIIMMSVGCVPDEAGLTNGADSENDSEWLTLPPPDEPPSITVQSGDTEINWVVGKNIWDFSIYDRLDNFQWIMSDTVFDELPYILNGEEVTITFDSKLPDSVTLTEHILRESGDEKYNIPGMDYNVTLKASKSKASFRIEPNWMTALSSFSGDYAPGATIKGYRLVCSWGDNECEYGFIIRGDAAVIMTIIDESEVTTVSQEDWAAVYIQTFRSYFLQDTALNEDINYIAIDLSSLEYASADERESVADYFSSVYLPVIDADLEKLMEEGLYDESIMGLPNGVLLQIQSVTRNGDEIIIGGMKYRSGLGANGFETKWTVNANGSWTMHDTYMTWIA